MGRSTGIAKRLLPCLPADVIAAIVAVVAAVAAAWQKFEGFRVAVLGAWGVVKEFGRALVSAIVSPIKQILKGIGSLGEAIANLFEGTFDAAATAAKQGFKDIGKGVLQSSPAGIAVNTWKNGNYAKAWEDGKQAGHQSWANSQSEKAKSAAELPKELEAAMNVSETAAPAVSTQDLLKKMDKSGKDGKSGKGSKTKQTLNLNEEATNYAQSANYLAATQKLAPVTAKLLPIGDVAQAPSVNGGIAKTQAITQTNSALTVDVSKQEYEPEGTNYLSDIMANVRKIAAAVMLPMAVSLASPSEASATTNILSQSKTQNVSASSMTVQSDALSLSSNDNGSVIDLSKPYEVTLPEIVITPGSESKSLANTVLSAPSAVSNLSNALTLSDTGNQAFDNAVAMNGPQAMPKPFEVTLPEIVITPGSNNTELAQDIESASLMGDTLTSASSTGDTVSEASAQSEAVNISNAVPELTNAREKAEPKRKGIRGWLANKFQPLLASVGGTSAELHNLTGGDTMQSVNATSDTLNQSMGSYADNSISMPSMSESLSDATDIASSDNSQSQTFNSSVQESSSNGSRNVTIDRVCDQIVINVENTDGQGAEEIRSRILEVLNEIVEG